MRKQQEMMPQTPCQAVKVRIRNTEAGRPCRSVLVGVHTWMCRMISLLLSAGKKRFILAATQDSLLRGSRPPLGFTSSRTGTVEVWVCTDDEPW